MAMAKSEIVTPAGRSVLLIDGPEEGRRIRVRDYRPSIEYHETPTLGRDLSPVYRGPMVISYKISDYKQRPLSCIYGVIHRIPQSIHIGHLHESSRDSFHMDFDRDFDQFIVPAFSFATDHTRWFMERCLKHAPWQISARNCIESMGAHCHDILSRLTFERDGLE